MNTKGLVQFVAKLASADSGSVGWLARRLVTAGLIAPRRPGLGSCLVRSTPRDAAALLIALAAPEGKRCAHYVRRLGSFQRDDGARLVDVLAEILSTKEWPKKICRRIWLPTSAAADLPAAKIEWHLVGSGPAGHVEELFHDWEGMDASFHLFRPVEGTTIKIALSDAPSVCGWLCLEGRIFYRLAARLQSDDGTDVDVDAELAQAS